MQYKVMSFVVLVGLLAALGYFYLDRQKQQEIIPTTEIGANDGQEMSTPEIEPGWERLDTEYGVSFSYPVLLPTEFMHATDWPPLIRVLRESFSCSEAGIATGRAGKTEKRTINGREYCVTEVVEGAAGSMYTQYAYLTPRIATTSSSTLAMTFTIQASQCTNYDDQRMSACEEERKRFSIDELVDEIIQTILP